MSIRAAVAQIVDPQNFPDEIKQLSWLPQTIREDLLDAWRDYDLMRGILEESMQVVTYHGSPSPAIDAAMEQCASGSRTIANRLIGIQNSFRDPKSQYYSKGWLEGIVGQTRQKCGFAAFTQSVLTLHNLVSHMRTKKQLDSILCHFLELQAPPDYDTDDGTAVHWRPQQRRKSSIQDNETISAPELHHNFQARPSRDLLAESDYTFDAVITRPTDSGITYIPARGLWDTGSNAFMISKQLLNRAEFSTADIKPVTDILIDGVGGAICKPVHSIELTWYVNRNMNSRNDLFYIHEEDCPFDILVPHNLIIGSRFTGLGKTGQTALVLQLRHKSKSEKEQEKLKEQLAVQMAGEKRKRRMDEAAQQRKIQRHHRESMSSVSSVSTVSTGDMTESTGELTPSP